jgi:hypothetical protein
MKEVYVMKNEITKAQIYATVKEIIEKGTIEGVSEEMLTAITARMDKDIEQASKKSSGSKKPTENDILNGNIQDKIVAILSEKDSMVYADFVKAVQGEFPDLEISAQKVTANVTKLKGAIAKYEDGKGKDKKLYIKLA